MLPVKRYDGRKNNVKSRKVPLSTSDSHEGLV